MSNEEYLHLFDESIFLKLLMNINPAFLVGLKMSSGRINDITNNNRLWMNSIPCCLRGRNRRRNSMSLYSFSIWLFISSPLERGLATGRSKSQCVLVRKHDFQQRNHPRKNKSTSPLQSGANKRLNPPSWRSFSLDIATLLRSNVNV